LTIARDTSKPTEVSRWRWPSLEPERARLLNRLHASAGRSVLTLGGQPYELSFSPKATGSKWGLTLIGKWNEATVAAFLPAAPALDWLAGALSPDLRGADLLRLPSELATAAVESLLEEALSSWAKAFGGRLELTEVSFQEKSALDGQGFLPFLLARPGGGEVAPGAVAFSGDLKSLLREGDGSGGNPWPPEVWQAVPLEVAVEVGRATLPAGDLRGIESGDVLIADECAKPGAETEVRVRVGRRAVAQAVLKGRKVEVRGELMADKPVAASAGAAPGAAPARTTEAGKALDPNELQVEVVFEIDSRLMTLKELQGFKPGMILETVKGLEAPVSLRVNGRRLGTGELVEVGGKVGVRLLTLSAG